MNSIVQLILSMSVSGSVLIIILILLKPLSKEGFSKAWQYYIWIIVLVRLLVPYSPEYSLVNDLFQSRVVSDITIPQSSGNDLIEESASGTANVIQQGHDLTSSLTEIPAAQTAAEHINSSDLWEIAGFLWIIGIVLLFLVRISRYAYFLYKLKRNAEPIADSQILLIYQRTAKELNIRKRPQIFYSGQLASPMLIGLRKPSIFLTDITIHMEEKSLSYVLKHELMHYKRHDLWYKWCCDITLCIHWFNPLVYIMSRYINSQCEISCDESLAKNLSLEEKQVYGNVLLKAAAENIKYHRQVLSSALYEDKRSLKERILSIMNAKRKSRWIISLSVVTAMLLCVAAFWLGVYTTTNGKTKDGADNTDASAVTSGTTIDMTDTSSDNTDITKKPVNQQPDTTTTPLNSSDVSDENTQAASDNIETKENIVYSNEEYGFEFTLPVSWDGYSTQTEDWQGTAVSGDHAGEVVESGKKIILRHPDWTEAKPYQDIPIMVFTFDQWDRIMKEELSVSAAPIGPSKLGSNSKYVFALPARYNFAYPAGYEEVEKIMESNPLTPNENYE